MPDDLYTADNVGGRTIEGRPPQALPQRCPFTIDDLILPSPGGAELTRLRDRLAAAAG